MPVKILGDTTGSVTLAAPDTGSDVTMTLPGSSLDLAAELASKLPIAGGKILQIVRATDATNRTTTSTSFVDASISVTITPQKSDSAILVLWCGNFRTSWSTGDNGRGSLVITDSSNNPISPGSRLIGTNNLTGTGTREFESYITFVAYVTPAVISPVTYKLRFASDTANTTVILNTAGEFTGQLYAIEVSA
jgi:hypothetical protein